MRARLLTLVVLAMLVVVPAAPAGAHADLISSCPGGGDRLREISTIEMTFGEPILDDGLAKIDLLDISGEEFFDVGPVRFSDGGTTLTVDVLEELPPGFYVARVTGTSSDGDRNGADRGYQFEIDPDRSPDSDTCDLPPEQNTGGWILMGVGIVAVMATLFFLRPTGSGDADSDTDSEPEPQV